MRKTGGRFSALTILVFSRVLARPPTVDLTREFAVLARRGSGLTFASFSVIIALLVK